MTERTINSITYNYHETDGIWFSSIPDLLLGVGGKK